MRRIPALLLSAMAVLLGEPREMPREGLPRRDPAGTVLTVHYYRYRGDYEPWDLWVWADGLDGRGYPFTSVDEYGAGATIRLEQVCDRVGFLLRKSGDAWSGKDVAENRYVETQNGAAEIWLLQDEYDFATREFDTGLTRAIRSAYLDSRRTIVVNTSVPLKLKGGTEGFNLEPWLPILSVQENRLAPEELGYEFIPNLNQIRFVLTPGLLGFPIHDRGRASVYVSGSFNNWGNTAKGGFRPLEEWKMTWNGRKRRYEYTAPVGTGPGQIPPSGSQFKFTKDEGRTQVWYPSQNVAIKATTGDGAPTEVLITLGEDADVAENYILEHSTMRGKTVVKRRVLNDPAYLYTGDDLGLTYTPDASRFRLWAPTLSSVSLVIYDGPTAEQPSGTYPMNRDEGGTWLLELPGDQKGKYYTYLLGGKNVEVVDPYAVGAAINGNRALILDLRETDPEGFRAHERPPFGSPVDAVIYEIHVRDISMSPNSGIEHKGKFLGFTEAGTKGPEGVTTGLDHLKELGITHVHLLPVFDYATVDEGRSDQYNWGYDPKNYNVPEGSYATDPNGTSRIREFKQMVQTMHTNGLRVVMDVVYNHTYIGASPFEHIDPYYYYRWDQNGRMSNGSGTGNEIATERSMTRKYVADSVKYWATEYKVDGFRFDLMGLIDIETMKAVRAALDEIDPSIIIYGEPWTGGESPLPEELRMGKGKQKGLNIAVFNDNIRNGIKGDNDGTEKGFATGASGLELQIKRGVAGSILYSAEIGDFCLEPTESVNYVSSHDNLTLWDKINKSNATDSWEEKAKMSLLCEAIIMTSQGIPFIHGGAEMLRTKGGNRNSYNAPDWVNMLDWGRKFDYKQIFDYHKGLIQLRKGHPAFRMASADLIRQCLTYLADLPANTVGFRLGEHANGDPWKEILVIYNPNKRVSEVSLPPGDWQIAAWGMEVKDGQLEPGSVHSLIRIPPISMAILFQQ